MPIPSQIEVDYLRSLVNQGQVAQAWNYLAQKGDTYADNAYQVTAHHAGEFTPNEFSDMNYGRMVENHWNNTAGPGAYEEYFVPVAQMHIDNYLDIIQERGRWPTTREIEESYRDAVQFHGLPAITAFDSLISGFDLALPADFSWGSVLGMEPGRIVYDSDVFADLPLADIASTLAKDIADYIGDYILRAASLLDPSISDFFLRAQRWVQRRDPLTFDLDGDGIETVGIDPNSPILFDHDGDGTKTATGWIKADDAFLVLDRNGNGTIDNGTELFGDSTPLNAGGNAADGFAALQDQDTNHDGVVNANDTNFANLRLWQDLNQDGISQAGELFTLSQKGIASITVAKTENNTLLPDGNVLADVGSYTKTDGTTGTLGETGSLGDVDLSENTFFSQFTDATPILRLHQTMIQEYA